MKKLLFLIILLILVPLLSCLLKEEPERQIQILVKAEINNYQDLWKELERRKIPFPEGFTKVSIVECGWKYESYFAKNCHNLFGFICVDSCNNGHNVFPSKDSCLDFLEKWISFSPPDSLETFIHFIERRRWNPNPRYYVYVRDSIEIVREIF